MEERNIIKWSEHSEYTELTIPSGEIWMSESEMVDLFGVFIPKLRNAIKAIYKEELIKPYEAEKTIKKREHYCPRKSINNSLKRPSALRF